MTTTTTSSSSAPARAAARSPTGSRPPASASCCSSAAATCRASPRTGTPSEVFLKERYLSGEEWIDKDGNAFRPHQQYFVGGNTKFYGAILFRLRERDFGEVRHYGGRLAGVADLTYDDLEPYYAEAERLYLVHGERGEDPTEAAGAPGRSPTRPSRTSRASSSSTTTSCATGHHPFHLPVGVDLDESDPEGGPLRALRPLRRLPVPDRRQGRRARAVRAARARARRTSRCARTRSVERLETDASGRSVTEVVVDRRGARGALQRRRRRRLLRRRQLGRAAAALGERAPPARAGQLLRRGRPPLHGPHQLGRDRDLAGRRTRRSSRRRSASTTTTGAPTTSTSRSGTSRCSARATGTSCAPARRGSRPGCALDYMARHAIDFWLTTEDLPHPDNRVTVDRSGPHPPGQDRPQHRAPPAPAGQAQGAARPPRLPRDADPELVGPRPAHPARRRRAPVRHRALRRATRRRRRSTSTARPTTSTTSTSSTRASSRRRSAVNPALTAMANALRVGDHLIERLGATRRAPSCRRWRA